MAYVSLFMLVGALVMIAAPIRFGDFPPQLFLALAIGAALYGLALWAKHAFRGEAEPLVRFLQKTVGQKAPRRSRRSFAPLTKRLRLNLDGTDLDKPVDAAAIEQALLEVGAGGFLILASAEEVYVQTASEDGLSYILERRDGGAQRHFHARRSRASESGVRQSGYFSSDEVLLALMAFATDTPMPDIVSWEPMDHRAQG